MKNLDYKGMNSTRVKLVLLAFVTATGLLALDKIDASHWVTVTMGSIVAYAMSETGNKWAEAHRDKPK